MNKVTKAAAVVLAAVMLAFAAASCSANVPANTVFSQKDLPGKKIGVQMGTTGDIYASDYEKKVLRSNAIQRASTRSRRSNRVKSIVLLLTRSPQRFLWRKTRN